MTAKPFVLASLLTLLSASRSASAHDYDLIRVSGSSASVILDAATMEIDASSLRYLARFMRAARAALPEGARLYVGKGMQHGKLAIDLA